MTKFDLFYSNNNLRCNSPLSIENHQESFDWTETSQERSSGSLRMEHQQIDMFHRQTSPQSKHLKEDNEKEATAKLQSSANIVK